MAIPNKEVVHYAEVTHFKGELKTYSALTLVEGNLVLEGAGYGIDMKDSNGVVWEVRVNTSGELVVNPSS